MSSPPSLLAIEIRPATAADAPEISRLANATPGAASWSGQHFLESSGGDFAVWVAVADGTIAGFLIARAAADESELLNMGVRQAFRRCKVGARLLDTAVGFARAHGATRMFLEVRGSNRTAIAFYKWAGFEESGRRKAYYGNPTEDARLLTLRIK